MKTRSFEVPVDMMPEFAEILGEHELNNTIKGINDNNCIVVDVNFNLDAVMKLVLLLNPDDEECRFELDFSVCANGAYCTLF